MLDLYADELQSYNIWDKLLYEDERFLLDVYYLEGGHPKMVHDKYGAAAIDEFRDIYINKILNENKCKDIWRLTSDSYAILHKESNIPEFTIQYKELNYSIKKKKVIMSAE